MISRTFARVVVVIGLVAGCGLAMADKSTETGAAAKTSAEGGEEAAVKLLDSYLAKYKPIWRQSQEAWWEANTTGSDAAVQRKTAADTALIALHGDAEVFKQLKKLREGGGIKDPVLARRLDVMYRNFLPAQADAESQKRIVALQNEVEQIFNNHRSEVGGKQLSENDVRKILSETRDSEAARQAWMGYMQVGKKVDGKLAEAVKLRNKVARELGFENYYLLNLAIQEIEPEPFFELFDELDELTREPFAALKKSIDRKMAERFGIEQSELRPWHYGDLFFQAAPSLSEGVDLDALFADADLIALNNKYYASLGMPCEDIIARSDLYERPGKSPHAFCTDLDRKGDIRVLCNLKPNLYWMDTLLHEIGHAVYDKYIRDDVPFLLHTASHSITTEGVAMMFGAMSKNEEWLVEVLGLDAARATEVVEAARAELRAEKLIFSRWTQVMVRFEHGMYSNPDQDLSKLWWDLKRRYQLLTPPDDPALPGYAAKVHVLTTPVYYHSYLMGDLFASQVQAHVARKILHLQDPTGTSFYGKEKVGDYMKAEVFGPGNLYPWHELTRRATGEDLTAKHFAEQYIK